MPITQLTLNCIDSYFAWHMMANINNLIFASWFVNFTNYEKEFTCTF